MAVGFATSVGNATSLNIKSNGYVGIYAAIVSYPLQVGGEPAANGYTAFTNYSDRRLKENIESLDDVGYLEKILSLNPSTFNYNDLTGYDEETKARTVTGFIAQELQEFFPDMVGEVDINGVEYLDTNLSSLPIYTIKALQEMNIKIEGINNMEVENSFRNSLISWLSNAGNKITRIFTGEICLTDEGGDSECINKSELRELKSLLNNESSAPEESNSPEELPPSAPLPEEKPPAPAPAPEPEPTPEPEVPTEEEPVIPEEETVVESPEELPPSAPLPEEKPPAPTPEEEPAPEEVPVEEPTPEPVVETPEELPPAPASEPEVEPTQASEI